MNDPLKWHVQVHVTYFLNSKFSAVIKLQIVYKCKKNCSLSKNHKSLKRWYYLATHWHLGNVMVGNITFYDFCCFRCVTRRYHVYKLVFFTFIHVRIISYYRHDGAPFCGIFFTHGPIFRVFGTWATYWTDQGEIRSAPPCQISSCSVQRCGFTPYTLKIWNSSNIITCNGRVDCTILTKFTRFMSVIILHNSAKFGCFRAISHHQPNFRWLVAAKFDETRKR